LVQVQRVKWHQFVQKQAALRTVATGQRRMFAQMGQMQPQTEQRPTPMPGRADPMPPATTVVQLGSGTVALPPRVRIPQVVLGGWDDPGVSSTLRAATVLGGAAVATSAADQAEAAAKRQEAAERKAQWLKELRAAAEAESEHRQAQAERRAQWLKELRAAAAAEKEHRQAQFDKFVPKANADAETRKQAAVTKFKAEQQEAQENKRKVAIKWSVWYDNQLENWQARNTTWVGGRPLTPDQVAALNAENQKTYHYNRSPEQKEDDVSEAGGGGRPNGTKGFTPIVANTDNTPPPQKEANYVPKHLR
jgi:hypothetical protein